MLAIHRSPGGGWCKMPETRGRIWWEGLGVSGDGFSGQGFFWKLRGRLGGLRGLTRRESGKGVKF